MSILGDLARARARRRGDRRAYLFLADGEREAASLTWRRLAAEVDALAVRLAGEVPRGERALLVYPPGLELLVAFLACLDAGVVAVPVHPPRPRAGLGALPRFAADAEARLVLGTEDLLARLRRGGELPPPLAAARWLATGLDAGAPETSAAWQPPVLADGDLAFLQYTSGSTAAPRGVMVSHGNLAANEAAIQRAFAMDESSVVVSWLPPYHDMGLIGTLLQPLWCGGSAVLFAPLAFLQRPRRWLEAVTRYRATTTGGPDFAYALTERRVPPAERAGLDLSSLRVAFSGAEPVRPATLERFARAFAPCGLRPDALYPCYGLAEATLFVSGGAVGEAPVVRPMPAAGKERVGCGRAWPGEDVAIADPRSGRPLPPGREGEVRVAGPAVARGYWRRPEESARTFGQPLVRGGRPFLRTGDLGVLDGAGELFVTGRIKDLLVVRGRNLHPHDLEATTEAAHAALRPAGAAAFGVEVAGEERVVVACEVERREEAAAEEAARRVRAALVEAHDLAPWQVLALRAGGLPRTTSGKVRRQECRRRWQAGELEPLAVVGGGPEAQVFGEVERLDERGEVRERPPAAVPHREDLVRLVCGQAAAVTEAPVEAFGAARLHLDSLQAVELAQRLGEATGTSPSLELLLSAPRVEEVAAAIEAAAEAPADPGAAEASPSGVAEPVPLDAGSRHPLSDAQHALWLRERLDPAAQPLVLACAARMRRRDGRALAAPHVEAALYALSARHPALRASFPELDDDPVMEIGEPHVDFAAAAVDAWDEAALLVALDEAAAAPFDLARGPLLRARWWHGGAAGHGVLLLAVHHLVCDFASFDLLLSELAADLAAPEAAVPPGESSAARAEDAHRRQASGVRPAGTTVPRSASLPAVVRARHASLAGSRGDELARWWRRELAGVPPRLELPADRPRPAVAGRRGAAHALALDAATAAAVRAAARRAGATPFAWMLALWQAVLGRWAGAREVPVGVAAGDRPAGAEGVVGHLVNLLPVRSALDARSAGELAAGTGRRLAAALAHRELPFPRIVEAVAPPRDPSHHPLVQAGMVLESPRRPASPGEAALALGEAAPPFRLGGLEVAPLPLARWPVELDLQLMVVEHQGGLAVSLQYAAELFDAATAVRLAGWWRRGLEAAVAEPERRWQELPLLSPGEADQLRADAATPLATEPPLVHRAFAAWAARAPEAPAVLARGEAPVSYGELAALADRLTRRLTALGVGPEEVVAILTGRTPARLVAMLAALTAGGCFVALEPTDPPRRQAALLAASGARVLVTGAGGGLPEHRGPRLELDDRGAVVSPAAAAGRGSALLPPPAADHPEAAAYVVFTSGSTGVPKGVVVPHRAIAALAASAERQSGLGPGARDLHLAALSFDVAMKELLAPLAAGAAVALGSDEARRSGRALVAEVRAFAATHLTITPAILGLIPPGAEPPSLRAVFCGGEVCPPTLAGRWAGRVRLFNAYGPTETTVYSTLSLCPPGDPAPMRRLGAPAAGTRVELVDRHGAPALPGALGEIEIGGRGVARGYLRDPAATAARFVPDSESGRDGREPGARRYRTGDLARRQVDGGASFAGRADQQVKVRGVRLEPAEVEAALAAHPAVAAAAVDRRGEVLAAWLVPRPDTRVPPAAELRAFLAGRLPQPLVPTRFVAVEALPQTRHGKVDRAALALPPAAAGGAAPAGELQRTIARLWAEELGLEAVPADVSFFDLGGHSLALARLHGRLCRALGREVSLPDLFSHATVAGLAAHLGNGGDEDRAADADARAAGRRDAMAERLRRRRDAAAAAGGSR